MLHNFENKLCEMQPRCDAAGLTALASLSQHVGGSPNVVTAT